MAKHTDSLVFRFGIIFSFFTVIMLVLTGIATYSAQNSAYKLERETAIQQVGSYLEEVLTIDGENFVHWQEYFSTHADELLVPYDFKTGDVQTAQAAYEELLATHHPGKVLGVDIEFEELSDEVKSAYTVYKHEYYLDQFEQSRERFNLAYVEYLIPNEQTREVTYALDAWREERIVNDEKYIELGISVVHDDATGHQIEWDSWINGVPSKGFDVFDNEYGKEYACYTPVFINGQKLGLIGVEVDITTVNREILHNTFRQILYIGLILIVTEAGLLCFIYRKYISKLISLKNSVKLYSQEKDASIAVEIEKTATGKDEISVLAQQVSAMIMELENYMQNLFKTKKELSSTKEQADIMKKLAKKDALTGLRNKTAYDIEVHELEQEMRSGPISFALVMIDLNFLKKINDTYGHEQGNVALKKLSNIISNTFTGSTIFRIGGDEFVVLLKNEDYENRDTLVNGFKARMLEIQKDKTLQPAERISSAIGLAVYNPETDSSVAHVFRRADQAMYQNKKEMKAARES